MVFRRRPLYEIVRRELRGNQTVRRMTFSSFKQLCLVAILASALNPTARAAEPEKRAPPLPDAVALEAALLSSRDVRLRWNSPDARAAGQIVEWATDPRETWVTLAFALPDVRTFVHSDLPAKTTSYYRIRPYYGPASDSVEVTTGAAAAEEKDPAPADPTWADPKKSAASQAPEQGSIRDRASSESGRPTRLQATLVAPTKILLSWTDASRDEEGYMIEIKKDASSDFQICAITEPNVTSIGYPLVPPETKVLFRVRPYVYGPPSTMAHITTGDWAGRMGHGAM